MHAHAHDHGGYGGYGFGRRGFDPNRFFAHAGRLAMTFRGGRGPWGPHPRSPWGGPEGHGGPGGPPWARGGFPWGGPPGWRRGPKANRGDVRTAILALLAEQPMHGYQIIQELSARSGGTWRPSPGSVYPTLQQLEDEGLVEGEKVDGRRVVRLTEAGQAWVAEHGDEVAAVWQAVAADEGDERVSSLFGQLAQVAAAVVQVSQAGNQEQVEEASRLLGELRGRLYRLLADMPVDTPDDTPDDQAEPGPDDIRRA
jgi:DNA-binding PadR family transcriptional regulator